MSFKFANGKLDLPDGKLLDVMGDLYKTIERYPKLLRVLLNKYELAEYKMMPGFNQMHLSDIAIHSDSINGIKIKPMIEGTADIIDLELQSTVASHCAELQLEPKSLSLDDADGTTDCVFTVPCSEFISQLDKIRTVCGKYNTVWAFTSHFPHCIMHSIKFLCTGIESDEISQWSVFCYDIVTDIVSRTMSYIGYLDSKMKSINRHTVDRYLHEMILSSAQLARQHGLTIDKYYSDLITAGITSKELVAKNKFTYLKTLFPPFKNENLRFSLDYAYSITQPNAMKQILAIMQKILPDCSNMSVMDANANIGVSSYWLSTIFKSVHSIEMDPTTFKILSSNVAIFKSWSADNITVELADCTKKLNTDSAVIFFDPPWTGSDYGTTDRMKLYLSGRELCNVLADIKHRHIFMKVPRNFDMTECYRWNPQVFTVGKFLLVWCVMA